MKKVEEKSLWWFFMGIIIAFALQVIYDGTGVITDPLSQYAIGISFVAIAVCILSVWYFKRGRSL